MQLLNIYLLVVDFNLFQCDFRILNKITALLMVYNV